MANSAPSRPADHRRKCGTRYPAKAHEFARRLYADGDEIPEIRQKLAKYGYFPTPSMIHRWVKPEVAEAVNLAKRTGPKAQRERRLSPWWVKRQRMRELRSIGLSALDVARVMNHDYGMKLNRDSIRAILGEDGKGLKRPQMVIERASRGGER